ncbi:unnamed protein product [Rotaria sp. Silwood2]|nr:unnamed protein product [Rotaria sp. Silwood2]CAF3146836.1 unnamed protein product [Rotaria sp. Silwood2]CAF4404222.1 unnamed protein product [Rotaria sp. Silwood2]
MTTYQYFLSYIGQIIIGLILLGTMGLALIVKISSHNNIFSGPALILTTATTKPAANNVSHSKWPINKLVIVPAIWKEIHWSNRSSWPLWLRVGLNMTGHSSMPYHVHLYQRIDPKSRPPYNWSFCRNVHEEAGVYLQFIYDYYYDLPEKILFIHGNPFAHSTHPIEAALCICDDVHYTSVISQWIKDRSWSMWRRDSTTNVSLMYQCASRILQLFGYDAELQLNPTKINPKENSIISTYCCAQF